jgi:2-keto-4-pentenoate hydratase
VLDDDAYRVQGALVALKLAEGRTIKARKLGLTSRAMQHSRLSLWSWSSVQVTSVSFR